MQTIQTNNAISNNNETKINCVWHTQQGKPTFAHPCVTYFSGRCQWDSARQGRVSRALQPALRGQLPRAPYVAKAGVCPLDQSSKKSTQPSFTGRLGVPCLLPARAWGSLSRTTSLSLWLPESCGTQEGKTWAPEPGDQNHIHLVLNYSSE